MQVNVQFSDATEVKIVSVFSDPQDPKAYPNQATIDASDARYQAFVNPASTLSGAQAANEVAIQAALDAKAQSRGYTDIKSACAYASTVAAVPSTDPHFATCEKFRLEGNALQSWMSLTWAAAYAYLATVTAGTNPMPTTAQAVAMIPAFTWPD